MKAENTNAKKIALFAMLTGLQIVLGLIDRSIMISALPGIRLGLANTVVLYALYMLNLKSAIWLVMIKTLTAGVISGSVTALMCSLCGGFLSLVTMILICRNGKTGISIGCVCTLAAEIFLLIRFPNPYGEILKSVILTGCAFLAEVVFVILIHSGKTGLVPVTSIAGGITHNIGQVIAVSLISHTPGLMTVYLPVLIGTGAAVGLLTGIIADRVIRILHGMGREPV